MSNKSLLIASAALGVLASAVLADAAAAKDAALDEVVVTARRVSEDLQASPVAVTAFSETAMRERAIDTIADVAKFTPSLSVDAAAPAGGSTNTATVFIRGIGQTDFNLTVDPGVGIYRDGVYISRSVGALMDTHDLADIQVLRGPQGTLFGKNTIGGAVMITSRAPFGTFGYGVDLTTGSAGRLDAAAWVNVPVSDTLRLYASALRLSQDGYLRRQVDGRKNGDRDRWSGRIVADWDATPDLKVRLQADGQRVRENGLPDTVVAINEDAVFPIFNNVFKNAPACLPPSPVNNPNCFNSQFLKGGLNSTQETGPSGSDSDLWGVSATVDWKLQAVSLKSITAYRHLASQFAQDGDGSPLNIADAANDYSQAQFSQEFQLQGEALDSHLNYLVGLYYLRETGVDRNTLITAPVSFLSGGAIRNTSSAIFSQVIWQATDRLSLTLGGRYSHDEKAFTPDEVVTFVDPRAQIPLGPGAPFPFFLTNPVTSGPAGPQPIRAGDRLLPQVRSTTKINEFTPSATLSYRMSPDMLAYVSYSEGFKAGGFTQRVFPPEAVTPTFEPERAKVYEVGLKVEGLDHRLRVNTAAFHTDYNDLQIIVTEGFAPKVRNAGRAEIQGVENETQFSPTDWLKFSGAVSYLDARYLEVDPRAAPVTLDSRLVDTPKWSGSLGVNAQAWRGELGRLSLEADVSYRSTAFKDAINTPVLRQAAFSVVNASATFYAKHGWTAAVGGTNLTDKRTIITGYSDLNVAGLAYAIYSRPREWYVRFSYQH